MLSSYQNNQKEARFYPFEVPRYKESISLCDTPKTKGHKKGCFYERSIPNFRDNKKITIKYYSVI